MLWCMTVFPGPVFTADAGDEGDHGVKHAAQRLQFEPVEAEHAGDDGRTHREDDGVGRGRRIRRGRSTATTTPADVQRPAGLSSAYLA